MAIHLRFFERSNGEILLPPTSDTPCPKDCIEKEANSLAEVDVLQKRLQTLTAVRRARELQTDEDTFAWARERVRADLTTVLASSATSQYERDFIREYLKLREEKRAKYHQRFACDVAYLEMRENDRPRNAEELIGESL